MSLRFSFRFFEALITLFIILSTIFYLLKILPGGPFDSDLNLPSEVRQKLSEQYYLDKSVGEQYTHYIKNVLKGDFGTSILNSDKTVDSIIAERLPVSLQLGFLTLILCYILGFSLGLYSALFYGTFFDKIILFLTATGVSLPSFIVGPLLVLIFSFKLDWFPAALWDGPTYMILPLMMLSLRPLSSVTRLVRVSALEILSMDFIRTARAKGVREHKILFKHVLKNSLLPVLSISGSMFADILSGSVITEMIFAIPGLGLLFLRSIDQRDYALILGVGLVYSFILVISNLIFDFVMMRLDPRLRTGSLKN